MRSGRRSDAPPMPKPPRSRCRPGRHDAGKRQRGATIFARAATFPSLTGRGQGWVASAASVPAPPENIAPGSAEPTPGPSLPGRGEHAPPTVIPAKAGISLPSSAKEKCDSGVRRNDDGGEEGCAARCKGSAEIRPSRDIPGPHASFRDRDFYATTPVISRVTENIRLPPAAILCHILGHNPCRTGVVMH